jgi:hypothetical protein
MKVGYKKAIEILFEEYQKQKATNGDPEEIQSIREGIEYLCYPFREDLSEDIRSPLQDPEDDSLNPMKADRSTPDKAWEFFERMSELSGRGLGVKLYALEILKKL